MVRILHLYLPNFPLQRWALEQPGLAGRPLVAVEEVKGLCRVAFVSLMAEEGGVCPGMTATAASALMPELLQRALQPAQDHEALLALAESLLCFSPHFQLDPPDGLWLVLEAAALFGGERAWVATVLEAVEKKSGYRAHAAVSGGLSIARLLSRRQPPHPIWIPTGEERSALSQLPISLLASAAPPPEVEALVERCRRLGLKRLGQVAELSRASLLARFGPAGLCLHRLAQGEDEALLNPTPPKETFEASLLLDWAAESLEPVLFSLKALLDRLCGQLQGRRRAMVRWTLTLQLESRGEHTLRIVLARPTAQPRLLLELARLQLEGVALSQPIAGLRVAVDEWCAAPVLQRELGDAAQGDAPLERVLTRLSTALGAGALGSLELRESHRPEAASGLTAFRPSSLSSPFSSMTHRERPSRLIPNPIPLEVRRGSAQQLWAIRWGGTERAVLAVAGPEKLRGDWWSESTYARDYYRVLCEGMGPLWLFEDLRDRRFYLHGHFD